MCLLIAEKIFSFSVQHGLLQVAKRAFFLWNNDHIVNLIAHNRQVILSIIFPALDRNVQSHWNPAVINLTHNIKQLILIC
uniref:Serine/threonine protein phosphatase 2A 57 kDa regulatory subunit B' beta isoform n=1 Tax=Cajanus cajan TaxID=3821 RepID=A0A151UBV6_CAJCA|nr:Serine/threonine protein phosphatase 2A 57 kDa regulatory subunit B' beta isoform [Cajanus cajan]